MNLRRPNSFQQRCRGALTALETPGLTAAAVLGSAAWIGTVIPAAAIIVPGGGQSDLTLSLKSALAGIDDRAVGFGSAPAAAGLPTPARIEHLRHGAIEMPTRRGPVVVKIAAAVRRVVVARHQAAVHLHHVHRRSTPRIARASVPEPPPPAQPRVATSLHAVNVRPPVSAPKPSTSPPAPAEPKAPAARTPPPAPSLPKAPAAPTPAPPRASAPPASRSEPAVAATKPAPVNASAPAHRATPAAAPDRGSSKPGTDVVSPTVGGGLANGQGDVDQPTAAGDPATPAVAPQDTNAGDAGNDPGNGPGNGNGNGGVGNGNGIGNAKH